MGVTKKKVDKLGVELSMLGFGCMRFPTIDGKINEPLAEKMLDDAYKTGINYFDTAHPYHDGASEPFVGKALSKYPRDSYYLATKLPCWHVNTLDDAKKLLDLQSSRIDGNYIDFYLLHALSAVITFGNHFHFKLGLLDGIAFTYECAESMVSAIARIAGHQEVAQIHRIVD